MASKLKFSLSVGSFEARTKKKLKRDDKNSQKTQIIPNFPFIPRQTHPPFNSKTIHREFRMPCLSTFYWHPCDDRD